MVPLPLTDLGNRLTELNKSVLRLHSEMKHLRRSVAASSVASNPLDGASVLRKYIMKVRNSFQSYDHDSGSSGQASPAEVVVHQEGEAIREEQDGSPLPQEDPPGEGKAPPADTSLASEEMPPAWKEEEPQPQP